MEVNKIILTLKRKLRQTTPAATHDNAAVIKPAQTRAVLEWASLSKNRFYIQDNTSLEVTEDECQYIQIR